MDKLRILQLSDIHNVACPRAMDDYKTMRQELVKDIKGYCDRYQCSFDAILICGDIAFGGAKDEYDKSYEFIKNICDTVCCKLSQVYVVPGNHDKERKEGMPALRRFLNWGMTHVDDKEQMFATLMKEEPKFFSNLYLPFKNYMEFSQKFANDEPIMRKCIEGSKESRFKIDLDADEMFWKDELTNDFHGYHVNLVGLNSSLNCDENDWTQDGNPFGHKMFLSIFAHNNIQLSKDKSINILMMHHPLDFIVNGANLRKKFDKEFSLQFYGHVHLPGSSQPIDGGAVRIYSGAMQPPKSKRVEDKKMYIPIYNIVELYIPDVNNQLLEVNLIVSRWNESSFENFVDQSKKYTIVLPETYKNRWEQVETKRIDKLPNGISKREIRCMFNEHLNHKKIINSMYSNFYEKSQNDYYNSRKFLKKLEEDNRWVDLWHLLNK